MDLKCSIKRAIQLIQEKQLYPIITPVDSTKLLSDKIALVSGGSGGIGMAIARKLIEHGAKVIISGTNEEKLSRCASDLGEAKYIVINMVNVNEFDSKIRSAVQLYPENRIDILVNAAGVANKSDFWHTEEFEYDSIMDVNVKGTFFLSKTVGKYMIENKIRGHILNLSSSSALRPAWTPYQMSKWAISGFTKGLADILLPHGIVVNAIAPGPTATPMLGKSNDESITKSDNPSGRFATPEEIANLAIFMVSSMGDLVVGDTFYITGGSGTISMHK